MYSDIEREYHSECGKNNVGETVGGSFFVEDELTKVRVGEEC